MPARIVPEPTPITPIDIDHSSGHGNGQAPPVDGTTFRAIMGSLPTGVCVVTALDHEANPRGLTCSAVCSLSVDPPLLLICVSFRNHSLDALRASRGFVVHVLREDRGPVSQLFASASPSKFSGVAWTPSPVLGLPLLHGDALAHAECRIAADLEIGDHAVLVGLITSGTGRRAGRPLMYWDRGYCNWPETSASIAR
jgi:flavin reductase (DIM6/NTAB) family NADH-FMN oxidoreductase RutF